MEDGRTYEVRIARGVGLTSRRVGPTFQRQFTLLIHARSLDITHTLDTIAHFAAEVEDKIDWN